MRRHRVLLQVLALAAVPATAFAAASATVVQRHRAFSQLSVTIARGGVVSFTNEDHFPHQIHVTGPGMDLDSDLQAYGEVVAVPFPRSGTFEVGCGIHPQMHSTVTVD